MTEELKAKLREILEEKKDPGYLFRTDLSIADAIAQIDQAYKEAGLE